MAIVSKRPGFFRGPEWEIHSKPDGRWPVETITAGACLDIAQSLAEIRDVLGVLRSVTVSDLDVIVREAARRARKAQRERARRASAKRRRTLAAKKGKR